MKRLVVFFVVVLALAFLTMLVLAQTDGFDLPWHTIASGDHLASDDGRYYLDSAIGQPLTGYSSVGARFEVESGFLTGTHQAREWENYLPLLVR